MTKYVVERVFEPFACVLTVKCVQIEYIVKPMKAFITYFILLLYVFFIFFTVLTTDRYIPMILMTTIMSILMIMEMSATTMMMIQTMKLYLTGFIRRTNKQNRLKNIAKPIKYYQRYICFSFETDMLKNI